MPSIYLVPEEAQSVVYGEHERFVLVEEEYIDSKRWTEIIRGVYRDEETGKLYMTEFERGLTEMQDDYEPFEYESQVEFREVVPREVTVTKYVPVDSTD